MSPWVCVDGWHLGTCFHDPMHVLWLGTCKDLYSSILAIWLRKTDFGGSGNSAERLRVISHELKRECKKHRFLALVFSIFPTNILPSKGLAFDFKVLFGFQFGDHQKDSRIFSTFDLVVSVSG